MANTREKTEFMYFCLQGDVDKIKDYIENGGRTHITKNGKSPFELVLSSDEESSIDALKYILTKTLVFPDVFDIFCSLVKNPYKLEKYEVLSKNLPHLFFCTNLNQHLKQMLILLEYEASNSRESSLFNSYFKDFTDKMTTEDRFRFVLLSTEKIDELYAKLTSKQRHSDSFDALVEAYSSVLSRLFEASNHSEEAFSTSLSDISKVYQRMLVLPKPIYDKKEIFEKYIFRSSVEVPAEYLSKMNKISIEKERFLEFNNNQLLKPEWNINLLRASLTNQKLYDQLKVFLKDHSISFRNSQYSIDNFFLDINSSTLHDADITDLKFSAAQAMKDSNFKLFEIKQTPKKKCKLNL